MKTILDPHGIYFYQILYTYACQHSLLACVTAFFDGQGFVVVVVVFFCGFSMGRNQYWAGSVYDWCVYYMTGTPEGSTESGFMEKPGIEPATPGLQGIVLIHYTTGA